MKTRSVAWALASATAIVTALGALVQEPSLAVGSVAFGGLALATSLHARFLMTRMEVARIGMH